MILSFPLALAKDFMNDQELLFDCQTFGDYLLAYLKSDVIHASWLTCWRLIIINTVHSPMTLATPQGLSNSCSLVLLEPNSL